MLSFLVSEARARNPTAQRIGYPDIVDTLGTLGFRSLIDPIRSHMAQHTKTHCHTATPMTATTATTTVARRLMRSNSRAC